MLKSSNLGKKFLSDYLELGLELKFVAWQIRNYKLFVLCVLPCLALEKSVDYDDDAVLEVSQVWLRRWLRSPKSDAQTLLQMWQVALEEEVDAACLLSASAA